MQPDDDYDDAECGAIAERAALSQHSHPTHPSALPVRPYLQKVILPILVHGLEATAVAKPEDPLEFLAAFLLANNPQRASNNNAGGLGVRDASEDGKEPPSPQL